MILVPGAAAFEVAFDWRDAYLFLGLLLLAVILPAGYLFIANRPQDLGLKAMGEAESDAARALAAQDNPEKLVGRDATFQEAVRTPVFMKLTFGYFV